MKKAVLYRKISMSKLISGLIGMEGKSLSNELIDMFEGSEDMPSVSAFIQQRDKLKPEAFEAVFHTFTDTIVSEPRELTILAADGSDVAAR